MLLSVGYSACHWCHVMERESFEDADIAALMNEHFVNIKVDREERPDVDEIYMQAVQAMTGRGGWPMTVFLTPDGAPFYGGTYFPPDGPPRACPAFPRLLPRDRRRLARRGAARSPRPRDQLLEPLRQSELLRAAPHAAHRRRSSSRAIPGHRRRVRRARRRVRRRAEVSPADDLGVPAALLAAHRQRARARHASAHARRAWPAAACTTRSAAAFTATPWTPHWLVPHFEKMLYDNAQLAALYLHAWLGDGRRRVPPRSPRRPSTTSCAR